MSNRKKLIRKTKKKEAAVLKGWLGKLRAVTDLKLLLAVFAVVMGTMGIFAYSFRQTWVGFIEEDGYVVTSNKLYDYLSSGTGGEPDLVLSSVSSQDEIYKRAGSYFVGASMQEFDIGVPLLANDGKTLFFMDDSAQLISEEFEPLMTYSGIFVTGGYSFNNEHEQKDIEKIYLVRLSNGLYMNVLPLTVKQGSRVTEIKSNTILYFGEEDLRSYQAAQDILQFGSMTDMRTALISIDGKEFLYGEFLEQLKGGGYDGEMSQPTPEEELLEEEETGEQERPEGSKKDEGDREKDKADSQDKEDKEEQEKPKQPAAPEAAGAPGGAGSPPSRGEEGNVGEESGEGEEIGEEGSEDGEDGDGTGSGDGLGGEDSEGNEDLTEGEFEGGDTPQEPDHDQVVDRPYIKPTVHVTINSVGPYSMDYTVTIDDEGQNLRKVLVTAKWNGTNGSGKSSRSTRAEGDYTLSNLRSGQNITFTVTMNYYDEKHERVKEDVQVEMIQSKTIEEGTNTLHLTYTPDTYIDDSNIMPITARGGYDKIYPHQIEIRDLKMWEDTDATFKDKNTTVSYIRRFNVNVYDTEMKPTLLNEFILSSSQRKKMLEPGGIDWKSEISSFELETDQKYYYDFSIVDRWGDSLKISYDNPGEYGADGKLLDAWAPEREIGPKQYNRMAYTCKEAPTGTLALSEKGATLDSVGVKVSIKNPQQCDIKDLYITLQDQFGRYIEYDNAGSVNVGPAEDNTTPTPELTDKAKFTLMAEGRSVESQTNPKLYIPFDGSTITPYANETDMAWDNITLPAYADTEYLISLKITYDTGDRMGSMELGQDNVMRNDGTYYNQVLSSRDRLQTSSFGSVGSINFQKTPGDLESHAGNFSFTSSSIDQRLEPVIYRYDYSMVNKDDENDKPFFLRISKIYEEEKKGFLKAGIDQGIVLDFKDEDGNPQKATAQDWHVYYKAQCSTRQGNFWITGEIYKEGDNIRRTIYRGNVGDIYDAKYTERVRLDKPGTGTQEVLIPITNAQSKASIAEAFAMALDLDTYAKLVPEDVDSQYVAADVTIAKKAQVGISFADLVEDGELQFEVNKNYTFMFLASNLYDACTTLRTGEDPNRDFSALVLSALAKRGQLNMRVTGLESNSAYEAEAVAYVYQEGSAVNSEDAKISGDGESLIYKPQITRVTGENTSAITITTLKAEAEVNMDLFPSSAELLLFRFYVLDKDGAIIPAREGAQPRVMISTYEYDSATMREILVDQRTIEQTRIISDVSQLSDSEVAEVVNTPITISVSAGHIYRVKVTAEAYNITSDTSKVKFNQLIGWDDSNICVGTGTWEAIPGETVTTGLILERAVEEDPYIMENQLINLAEMDNAGSGWQAGYIDTSKEDNFNPNMYYRTSGYIDIRGEDGVVDISDVYLMRGSDNNTVYYYDGDKNYLGGVSYLLNGATGSGYNIVTMPAVIGGKPCNEIAYVRIRTRPAYTNQLFFGRFDTDGYLEPALDTFDPTQNGNPTHTPIDVYGALMSSHNAWTDIWADITERTNNGERVYHSKHSSNVYKKEIDLSGYDRALINVRVFNANGGEYEKFLIFEDAEGNVIQCEGSNNSKYNYKYIRYNSVWLAPENAAKVWVGYDGRDLDPNSDVLIHVTEGSTIEKEYKRIANQFSLIETGDPEGYQVIRGRTINSSGGLSRTTDLNYEVTGLIPVSTGDVYMIHNRGQNVAMYYYDQETGETTFKSYTSASLASGAYLIIPEGVNRIRIGNYRENNSNYDKSLLNGITHNSDANRQALVPVHILKLGNLTTLYNSHNQDTMYVSLRVQLKDSDNQYFSNGKKEDGEYTLTLYGLPAEDDEILDSRFETDSEDRVVEEYVGVIDRYDSGPNEGCSKTINQSHSVPVIKGYTYKAVLSAKVGSYGSIKMDTVYFTISADDTPLYGISSATQFISISSDRYADYVLNRNITLTSENVSSGEHAGTFYGTLDLQGNTLTNTRTTPFFGDIGSSNQRFGTIKNGTLAVDVTIAKDYASYWTMIAGYNYGTFENIFFKIDLDYEKDVNGKDQNLQYEKMYLRGITYNRGTIRNFTVEYKNDVNCYNDGVGFIYGNSGLIEKGLVYGEGVLRGHKSAGALLYSNDTTGIVRTIYNTVDVMAREKSGSIGTIIGHNNGKAEDLLSTGNVYTYYPEKYNDAYTFTDEELYLDNGNTVGKTGGRMHTKDVYYANVGNMSRAEYSRTSLNTRIESGILIDADWHKTVMGEANLDSNVAEMLELNYYPWLNFGDAAKKYNMVQPYITLDISGASKFDLLKAEVDTTYGEDGFVYDDNGFPTARVKFTFSNPAEYTVRDIAATDLDIILLEGQTTDPATDFTEVFADVKVKSGGKYKSEYEVDYVGYLTTNNLPRTVEFSNVAKERVIPTVGYRYINAEMFYPLQDVVDWDEMFTYERKDWNFRIWGENDSKWDFGVPFNKSGMYISGAKSFYHGGWHTYSGHLDGTVFKKVSETDEVTGETREVWRKAIDPVTGDVEIHTLKNMSDYETIFTDQTKTKISTYYICGYILPEITGEVSNLNFEKSSVGILRPWHTEKKAPPSGSVIGEIADPFDTSSNPQMIWRTQPYSRGRHASYGLVMRLSNYGKLTNVHVDDSYMDIYTTGSQDMGGLAGSVINYTMISGCSVTDTTIATSEAVTNLRVGGLIGYIDSYNNISSCYTSGLSITIRSSKSASFNPQGQGGLIGYSYSGNEMMGCYSAGQMTSEARNTGGILGYQGSSTQTQINSCYSAMNIIANGINTGGIVGYNVGNVKIGNCLYTGTISASSESDTINLIMGSNAATYVEENNYVYQPFTDAADIKEKTVTNDQLKNPAFYNNSENGLFGDVFLYTWGEGNSVTGGFLPAAARDGILVYGQDHVPAIADPNMKISNIWAYESLERKNFPTIQGITYPAEYIYGTGNGQNLVTETQGAYDSLLKDKYNMSSYTPNDVDFTINLGSDGIWIRSITVDGTEAGGIFQTGSEGYLYDGAEGTAIGDVLGTGAVKNKAFRIRVKQSADDANEYYISISGLDVISYRDNYTLSVTLSNNITLSQSFQFRNSETGLEEAKYLKINNAYEWNLYMAESGLINQQDTVLPAAYEKYRSWEYKGYWSAGMNVELVGETIDGVDNVFDFSKMDVEPVMDNVILGNLRGVTDKDSLQNEIYPTVVKNLTLDSITKNEYGLAKTVNGSISNLTFENIRVDWENENAASNVKGRSPASAGLFGTVYGGMSNCNFKNVELLGGYYNFGIMGDAYGTVENIELVNIYVKAEHNQVGGLAGRLYGDMYNVTAYGDLTQTAPTFGFERGYEIISAGSNVGGIAGLTYDSKHEENGHVLIGGQDYIDHYPTAEDTNHVGVFKDDPNDAYGWYRQFSDKFYRDNASYVGDSLAYHYVVIKDVNVYNLEVNAKGTSVGGVTGQVGSTSSTVPGYGYMIAENIRIGQGEDKKVSVASTYYYTANTNEAGANVGGFAGQTRAYMAHNITINGVEARAEESRVGGFIGNTETYTSTDYGQWVSETGRSNQQSSYLVGLKAENIQVAGEYSVGGVFGRRIYVGSMYDMEVSNVTAYGTGTKVGGIIGEASSTYLEKIKGYDLKVYHSGLNYAGGAFGTMSAYSRNLDMQNIQVVSSNLEATQTGGVSGYYLQMVQDKDGDKGSVFKNIEVFGHDRVGGIGGYSNSIRDAEIENIRVTGTGTFVGGLGGQSLSCYDSTATNLYVTGEEACIGGIAGYGNNMERNHFSNITVIGNGNDDIEYYSYKYQNEVLEETTAQGGDAVGGIVGVSGGTGRQNIFEDISVYGYDKVGGVSGMGLYSMYYSTIEDINVKSVGKKYIGGICGSGVGQGYTFYYMSIKNITVNAPNAIECVGGVFGKVQYAVYVNKYNAQMKNLKIYAGQNAASTQYVGGFAGYAKHERNHNYLNIEVEIVAPKATYVGGYIGSGTNIGNPATNYVHQDASALQVVSKIYAYDMIGGLIGGVEESFFARGSMAAFVSSTQITSSNKNAANLAYFYNMEKADKTVVRDFSNYWANNTTTTSKWAQPLPYRLRLWDGSWIAKVKEGGGTEFVSTATTAKFANNLPGTEEQMITAAYWRGTTKQGVALTGAPSFGYNYGNALSLVSTDDLKTPLFYENRDYTTYQGMHFANMSTSMEESVSGKTVTYKQQYALENMVATSTYMNLYNINPDMNGGNYYLPSPISPLLYNEAFAKDGNGNSVYVDYRLGSAVLDYEKNAITYTITDGIKIPGETGALLTYTTDVVIPGDAPAIGTIISINTTPKLYATNAHILDVEFDTEDNYAGTWMHVYDANARKTNTNTLPLFSKQATADKQTYSFYYDFQTPLEIIITDSEAHKSEEGKTFCTLEVRPEAFTRRVVAMNDYLFTLNNMGHVVRYKPAYSADDKDKAMVIYDDAVCRNIVAKTEGIYVLTNSSTTGEYGKVLFIDPTEDPTDADWAPDIEMTLIKAAEPIPEAGSTETTTLSFFSEDEEPEVDEDTKLQQDDEQQNEDSELQQDEEQQVEEQQEDNLTASVKVREHLLVGTGGGGAKASSSAGAEPLYEFDFKGYRICTYLNYTLIYDGDSVSRRELQLFVKDDKLFALDAADDIIPGNIIVDTYKGQNYMTVLSKYGKMLDLMTKVTYPEDFVNTGIKNVSSNLYTDSPTVLVEYKNGNIVSFNYLTGSVYYEYDASAEGKAEVTDGDFLDFIQGFFQERLDIAYGDVTGAYQNALTMENYFTANPWQEWFYQEGGAVGDPSTELPDMSETIIPGTEATDPVEGTEMPGEPAHGTEIPGIPGETGEIIDGIGNITGTMDGMLESDAEMTEDGTGLGNGTMPGMLNDSTENGLGKDEESTQSEKEKAMLEALMEERSMLDNEMVISYSSDKNSYSIYSAGDLLNHKEEELTGLEEKLEKYVKDGGVIPNEEIAKLNLRVTDTQKRGILIISAVAICIGTLIVFMEMQKYTRRRNVR